MMSNIRCKDCDVEISMDMGECYGIDGVRGSFCERHFYVRMLERMGELPSPLDRLADQAERFNDLLERLVEIAERQDDAM